MALQREGIDYDWSVMDTTKENSKELHAVSDIIGAYWYLFDLWTGKLNT